MIVELEEAHYREIADHAGRSYPGECCGILLGRVGVAKRVTAVIPSPNLDARRSRERYRIPGPEILAADRRARAEGLEILGFYHSHPGGPAVPSAADRLWAWPGYSYLILSLGDGGPAACRSWTWQAETAEWIEESLRRED